MKTTCCKARFKDEVSRSDLGSVLNGGQPVSRSRANSADEVANPRNEPACLASIAAQGRQLLRTDDLAHDLDLLGCVARNAHLIDRIRESCRQHGGDRPSLSMSVMAMLRQGTVMTRLNC